MPLYPADLARHAEVDRAIRKKLARIAHDLKIGWRHGDKYHYDIEEMAFYLSWDHARDGLQSHTVIASVFFAYPELS